jgi:hypothetical protein
MNPFDQLKQSGADIQKSMQWYQAQVRKIGTINVNKLIREGSFRIYGRLAYLIHHTTNKMWASMVCMRLNATIPYLCLIRWTLTVEMASLGRSVETVLLRIFFRWRRVLFRKIPLISLEEHVLSEEKAVMIVTYSQVLDSISEVKLPQPEACLLGVAGNVY